MANNLSIAAILEKNKISSSGAWLLLLELIIPHSPEDIVVRIVQNNQDITWNGNEWAAFPFEIGSIKEDSRGELPSVPVSIFPAQQIVDYLEETRGGEGAKIIFRVVHEDHLDEIKPYVEETLAVKKISLNDENIEFDLGADIILLTRYPYDTYKVDHCTHKYCGVRCGLPVSIKETFPTCPRTLQACRERGNSHRFGGEPGMTGGGNYVSSS